MTETTSIGVLQAEVNRLRRTVPPAYGNIAQRIIERYNNHMKTFIEQPYEKIFVYDVEEKYWKEVSKQLISSLIQEISNSQHITKGYKENVYSFIKDHPNVLEHDNNINPYHIDGQLHFNRKFRLNNGIYDVNNKTFTTEEQPNEFIVYKLNFTYDEKVSTIPIKEYIIKVVGKKWEPTVKQMLGKCLVGNHKLKKLFCLLGPPDTGKSKLILIMEALFGAENCIHLTIDALSDSFTVQSLARMILNLAPEIKGLITVNDTGIIKSITGEDIIQKRIMHTQNTSKLYSIATNIFAINGTPHLSERIVDDGFYERFQFIPCLNVFNGDDKDVDIVKKMTTPEMSSAWFNYMLEGLQELEANEWVIENQQSIEDVKNIFKSNSVLSTIEKFSYMKCTGEGNFDNYEIGTDLHDAYKNFCVDEKEVAFDYSHFIGKFNDKCVFPHRMGKRTIGGKQIRVFNGIQLLEKVVKEKSELKSLGDYK